MTGKLFASGGAKDTIAARVRRQQSSDDLQQSQLHNAETARNMKRTEDIRSTHNSFHTFPVMLGHVAAGRKEDQPCTYNYSQMSFCGTGMILAEHCRLLRHSVSEQVEKAAAG